MSDLISRSREDILREAEEKAYAKPDEFQEFIGQAARWTAEIILDHLEDFGLADRIKLI